MKGAATEFWVLATSDKRKAGLLIGLVGVLLLVSGRALLNAGPAEASATSSSQTRRERMFSDAPSQVVLEATGVYMPVQRPKMPGRNVFDFDPAVFPPPAQTDLSVSLPPNSRTELADDPAEIPSVQELAEQEAMRFLTKLRLRSTVLGSKPLALIEEVSGRTSRRTWARPGDPVGPFTLERVESRSVVLEMNGVEYELFSDPQER